jgi:hypothetical protein
MRELICRRFVSYLQNSFETEEGVGGAATPELWIRARILLPLPEQEKSSATRGASRSLLIFESGNYPHQVVAVIYIIRGFSTLRNWRSRATT